jgi:type I restriction enzyme S subunit
MAQSQWIAALARGIRERSTDFRFDGFASQPVPVPPKDEQDAISRCLKVIERRINRLIRDKRRLIALLNEQKQAIIHRAVTRGLDPNVPLRTSGVPWFGDIPDHWEIKPLKRVSPRLAGRLIVQPHQYFVDDGVPIVFALNIRPGLIITDNLRKISREADSQFAQCRVRAGDLLTVRVGAPGTTAVIPSDLDGCHFASTMLIRQSPMFASSWLCYVMNSPVVQVQIDSVNYGAAQQQFNIGDAANFVLPVPPLQEQHRIAASLDTELASLDSAIASSQSHITLLREYRTRLIADVVTGKLDVRGVAVPDAAEDEALIDEVVALGEEDMLVEDEGAGGATGDDEE